MEPNLKLEIEIERNRSRLEFFKSRHLEKPSRIHFKWIEIYEERVKRLERQFNKAKNRALTMH
jgi:hypothetical protein